MNISELGHDVIVKITQLTDENGKYTDSDSYILPDILRVTGEITRTAINYPSTALVEFFNLNDETKTRLNGTETGPVKITLSTKVGYTFFTGVICNTITKRDGDDIVTTVYCGDSLKDWLNGLFMKSYKKASLKTIITDCSKTFLNITSVNFDQAPIFNKKDIQVKNYTAQGSTKDELNKLINDEDVSLQWFIDNNTIYFTDKSGFVGNSSSPVVTINSPTQIIGTPSLDTIYLSLSTQFLPTVLPNHNLVVDSVYVAMTVGNLFWYDAGKQQERLVGKHRIVEVVHNFDTRGGVWTTAMKAISPYIKK